MSEKKSFNPIKGLENIKGLPSVPEEKSKETETPKPEEVLELETEKQEKIENALQEEVEVTKPEEELKLDKTVQEELEKALQEYAEETEQEETTSADAQGEEEKKSFNPIKGLENIQGLPEKPEEKPTETVESVEQKEDPPKKEEVLELEKTEEEKPEEIDKLIQEAQSFDDLVSTIDNNNIYIQGSSELYTPDMLKDVIAKIRSREWVTEKATGASGFRKKVEDLLSKDNDVDFLKETLEKVENKLINESYIAGGSPDHPLNKRRAERLLHKDRLQEAIREKEETEGVVEEQKAPELDIENLEAQTEMLKIGADTIKDDVNHEKAQLDETGIVDANLNARVEDVNKKAEEIKNNAEKIRLKKQIEVQKNALNRWLGKKFVNETGINNVDLGDLEKITSFEKDLGDLVLDLRKEQNINSSGVRKKYKERLVYIASYFGAEVISGESAVKDEPEVISEETTLKEEKPEVVEEIEKEPKIEIEESVSTEVAPDKSESAEATSDKEEIPFASDVEIREVSKDLQEDEEDIKESEVLLDVAEKELEEKRKIYAEIKNKHDKLSAKLERLVTRKKDSEFERVKAEYKRARSEYVEASISKALAERIALVDAQIEAKITEASGKLGKVLEGGADLYKKVRSFYKKLGDINVGNTEMGKKFLQNRSKVTKIAVRMLSMRTVISAGLVAGGTALGGSSLIVAGAWRGLASGVLASGGTYDIAENLTDKKEKEGILANLTKEEIEKLSKEEIEERMSAIEARLILDGKKMDDVSNNSNYKKLHKRLRERLAYIVEGEGVSPELKKASISEFLDKADDDVDKRIKKLKDKKVRNFAIAAGVGATAASGLIGKGVVKAGGIVGDLYESSGASGLVSRVFGKGVELAEDAKEELVEKIDEITPAEKPEVETSETLASPEMVSPERLKEILSENSNVVHTSEGLTHPILRDLQSNPDHLESYKNLPEVSKLLEEYDKTGKLPHEDLQRASFAIYKEISEDDATNWREALRVDGSEKVAVTYHDNKYMIGSLDDKSVEEHLYTRPIEVTKETIEHTTETAKDFSRTIDATGDLGREQVESFKESSFYPGSYEITLKDGSVVNMADMKVAPGTDMSNLSEAFEKGDVVFEPSANATRATEKMLDNITEKLGSDSVLNFKENPDGTYKLLLNDGTVVTSAKPSVIQGTIENLQSDFEKQNVLFTPTENSAHIAYEIIDLHGQINEHLVDESGVIQRNLIDSFEQNIDGNYKVIMKDGTIFDKANIRALHGELGNVHEAFEKGNAYFELPDEYMVEVNTELLEESKTSIGNRTAFEGSLPQESLFEGKGETFEAIGVESGVSEAEIPEPQTGEAGTETAEVKKGAELEMDKEMEYLPKNVKHLLSKEGTESFHVSMKGDPEGFIADVHATILNNYYNALESGQEITEDVLMGDLPDESAVLLAEHSPGDQVIVSDGGSHAVKFFDSSGKGYFTYDRESIFYKDDNGDLIMKKGDKESLIKPIFGKKAGKFDLLIKEK